LTRDLAAFRRVYAEMVCAAAGSKDPRLLEAFATVPRERFLGPGPWKFLASPVTRVYMETPSDDPVYLYEDRLFAIDPARGLNNGLPSFLAFLIDAMALTPGARAVHVGTGVGYYTAIMAELVGTAGHVIGYEIDEDLAARAAENLKPYPQVDCRAGSGVDLGDTGLHALYINAGATHPLPNWLDALTPGGRLILPLTGAQWGGVVMKITRPADPGDRNLLATFLSFVGIYNCEGARDPRAEKALDRARKKEGFRDVTTLRRDRHRRSDSCWLHGRGWCLSTAPRAT
jgi:protein-L-isoaspartate(D-aspartate) O-methyltransferase